MSHIPTKQDAAADLMRAISASVRSGDFNNKNFKTFYQNAINILETIDDEKKNEALVYIEKFKDTNKEFTKRQEDLHMAMRTLL